MIILKFIVLSIVFWVMVLGLSMPAHSALELLGQGTSAHGTYNLIYDTDLDITWYDFTKFTAPWWQQYQEAWAVDLTVNFGGTVYEDWRLPVTYDNSCGYVHSAEYNCTNSEMGHLYYTELGNSAGGPLSKTGEFQNLQENYYWSSTEGPVGSGSYWTFGFDSGAQVALSDVMSLYAIAVMDGKAVVPEPISSILFIAGGTLLAGRRYIKRKNRA